MCGNIIDILMVFATFLAAIVALIGPTLAKKWFGPRLRISLHNSKGELTTTNNGVKIRYYHLSVENKRKNTTAHNAVVDLLSVEETCNGGVREIWNGAGEVPLIWIYPEVYRSYIRNIGPEQKCDLISVSESGLEIRVAFSPNRLTYSWKKACDLYLSVRVKSDEFSSEPLQIHVVWDGEWVEGDKEMQKHLVVTSK